MEILALLSLFYDHDLAIGRGHNQLVGIAVEVTNRTAVEIERHQPSCAKDDDENPKWYSRVEIGPEQPGDTYDDQCAQHELVGAFAVDPDLLQFLDSFSHEMFLIAL